MDGNLLPSGPRSAQPRPYDGCPTLTDPGLRRNAASAPGQGRWGQLQRLQTVTPRPARTGGNRPASAAEGQPGEGPGPACPQRQTVSALLPREASESLALRAHGLLSPRGANPQQTGWGHADTVHLALQAS